MPLIKRYPNRKLYDTEAKQYVTLSGIADLIRQGHDVQVVDHATGEDLTAITLTQIIFEQEKKRSGFVPKNVLTGLVQAGGDTMSTLRRALASPLDMAHHVDEEIERRVQALITRGELAAEEGRRLRDNLLGQARPRAGTSWLAEEQLEQALHDRGVPTHEDIQQIFAQLDALTDRLEEMTSGPGATETL